MKNWAGNVTYRARQVLEPRSVDELQEQVRRSSSMRVVGTRHSFNDIVDTQGDLISLERLPPFFHVDPRAAQATLGGAMRYADLCPRLDEAGFALHNLPSLPHISVAGAVATATHGSGRAHRNMSAAVSALELVVADGTVVHYSRADDRDLFAGVVVGLGALGVVTRLTLDLEPAYDVRQDVFEHLPFSQFLEHFDELSALAESVSFFTAWNAQEIDQIWVKRRADGGGWEPPGNLYGATPARDQVHPIRGMPVERCTPQLGSIGSWHTRLPHFRAGFVPSSGNELQSEYFVPIDVAPAAFAALLPLRVAIAKMIQVTEIRTIAADDLWLSPSYKRDSAAIHFTWRPDQAGVSRLLPKIEAALAPFDPRAHWGKQFALPSEAVRAGYARIADFERLCAQLDPEGRFSNAFIRRFVRGRSFGGPRA